MIPRVPDPEKWLHESVREVYAIVKADVLTRTVSELRASLMAAIHGSDLGHEIAQIAEQLGHLDSVIHGEVFADPRVQEAQQEWLRSDASAFRQGGIVGGPLMSGLAGMDRGE